MLETKWVFYLSAIKKFEIFVDSRLEVVFVVVIFGKGLAMDRARMMIHMKQNWKYEILAH